MVKLGELETATPTIQLESLKLGDTYILKAIKEKTVASTSDKVGGVVITFTERDIQEGQRKQRQITQKYSKSFATELENQMIALKINDTLELQKAFYVYEVRKVGKNIFPRLYPISKA